MVGRRVNMRTTKSTGKAAPLAPTAAAVGGPGQSRSPLIGQHVLVRTYSAGVHVGVLKAKDGENVLLENARRIWKWTGAFTLSEVSQNGVDKTGSRIAVAVPLIELPNANEIIPTSEKARTSFDKVTEA
jgi:hypothetical protein